MPVLPAAEMKEFVKDLESQPPEPVEGQDPAPEPAPAAGDPPAAEPPAVEPPAGGTPPPPTARTLELAEKEITELKAKFEEEGDKRAIARLQAIATTSPDLYRAIYNTEPPAGMFKKTPAPGAAADPNAPKPDPLKELSTQVKELRDIELQRRSNEAREALITTVEGHMAKHEAIFTHAEYGDLAQTVLAQRIKANPKADLAKLTADVAGQFTKLEESIKSKYVAGKRQVAATVTPGAGKAGGPTPGRAPEKLELGKRGKGGTQAALADFIRGEASQTDE